MFYEVTREGRPLRRRRYLYTETFGVIALSEYSIASGDRARWEKARQLYCWELLEQMKQKAQIG